MKNNFKFGFLFFKSMCVYVFGCRCLRRPEECVRLLELLLRATVGHPNMVEAAGPCPENVELKQSLEKKKNILEFRCLNEVP